MVWYQPYLLSRQSLKAAQPACLHNNYCITTTLLTVTLQHLLAINPILCWKGTTSSATFSAVIQTQSALLFSCSHNTNNNLGYHTIPYHTIPHHTTPFLQLPGFLPTYLSTCLPAFALRDNHESLPCHHFVAHGVDDRRLYASSAIGCRSTNWLVRDRRR